MLKSIGQRRAKRHRIYFRDAGNETNRFTILRRQTVRSHWPKRDPVNNQDLKNSSPRSSNQRAASEDRASRLSENGPGYNSIPAFHVALVHKYPQLAKE